MRRPGRAVLCLLAAGLAACAPVRVAPSAGPAASRSGVPRAECFPAANLPAELRAKSEEMLLRALDNEALYTLVGGLKPMSTVGSTFAKVGFARMPATAA